MSRTREGLTMQSATDLHSRQRYAAISIGIIGALAVAAAVLTGGGTSYGDAEEPAISESECAISGPLTAFYPMSVTSGADETSPEVLFKKWTRGREIAGDKRFEHASIRATYRSDNRQDFKVLDAHGKTVSLTIYRHNELAGWTVDRRIECPQ